MKGPTTTPFSTWGADPPAPHSLLCIPFATRGMGPGQALRPLGAPHGVGRLGGCRAAVCLHVPATRAGCTRGGGWATGLTNGGDPAPQAAAVQPELCETKRSD